MGRITKKSTEPAIASVNAEGIFLNNLSERLFTDLLQTSMNGTRPHSEDRSFTVMPWTHFRKMTPTVRKMNEALSVFDIYPHDPGKKIATGVRLKPEIAVNLGDLEGETPVDVETGRKIRKERHAVASKDSRGSRSTFRLDVYQSIPIDRTALEKLASSPDKIEAENAKAILRQSPEGNFLQQYQENQSGRLFGKGINLMNIRANVRRQALPSGAIEFDVQNCHAMALNWMATNLGYKTGILGVYALDPVGIREAIAQELCIPYDTAKRIALMSIYWSGINACLGIAQL